MTEMYVSLKEAAELEEIKYNSLVQKIRRSPEKYQVKKADGSSDKDLKLVAVSSLSKSFSDPSAPRMHN